MIKNKEKAFLLLLVCILAVSCSKSRQTTKILYFTSESFSADSEIWENTAKKRIGKLL